MLSGIDNLGNSPQHNRITLFTDNRAISACLYFKLKEWTIANLYMQHRTSSISLVVLGEIAYSNVSLSWTGNMILEIRRKIEVHQSYITKNGAKNHGLVNK